MPENAQISIVLPTRARPALAGRLLESIAATARRPDRLEVVLYLDADDAPSHRIDHADLNVTRLIGPRRKMGAVTRKCYEAGTGAYAMLLNDDAVCRTQGWDAAVLEAFARFDDNVALVWCNDMCLGSVMANFPILSRTACELMGGICPADYNRDYIDTHLFDVFAKLRGLGHDRLVYLQDVVIEHMHHEAGKADPDPTYLKARAELDELAFIAWDERRRMDARALARHIDGRSG